MNFAKLLNSFMQKVSNLVTGSIFEVWKYRVKHQLKQTPNLISPLTHPRLVYLQLAGLRLRWRRRSREVVCSPSQISVVEPTGHHGPRWALKLTGDGEAVMSWRRTGWRTWGLITLHTTSSPHITSHTTISGFKYFIHCLSRTGCFIIKCWIIVPLHPSLPNLKNSDCVIGYWCSPFRSSLFS